MLSAVQDQFGTEIRLVRSILLKRSPSGVADVKTCADCCTEERRVGSDSLFQTLFLILCASDLCWSRLLLLVVFSSLNTFVRWIGC